MREEEPESMALLAPNMEARPEPLLKREGRNTTETDIIPHKLASEAGFLDY